MRPLQIWIPVQICKLCQGTKNPRTFRSGSVNLAQEVGQQTLVASAQRGLAQILEKEGHYREALDLARQALQIRERLREQNLKSSQDLVARLQQREQD